MPYIAIGGSQIFYILHKISRPQVNNKSASIILIHGAGGNHLSMLPFFNYIKKKYGDSFNIVNFDLPGHFRSGFSKDENILNSDCTDGIAYYAETLNALYLRLIGKTGAIFLIGHSMGAQVCIKYASLFPNDIEKIMLIAGCHETKVKDSFIKSLENSFDRTIMLFLKDALNTRDETMLKNALLDIKRTSAQFVSNDFKYINYFSGHYAEDIKAINNSKIFFKLIYSKKDLIIKSDCMEELHKKLINSTISEIPAKNHMDFLYGNNFMEKEIDKFLLT